MPDSLPSSSPADLHALVDRLIGETYEIDREIGRGSMGVVYRAKDRKLLRAVAIKVLPPHAAFANPNAKQRFLREAEIAANLNHANIVPIYWFGETDPLAYFVMRFVEGETLDQYVKRSGPLAFEQARSILRQIADALAYAHERDVVHRDIKPENILLDRGGIPLVTDFSIARALTEDSARITAVGNTVGTPTYMSPEQIRGDNSLDGRSDLYSLGAVAYEMLTGHPPFAGTQAHQLFHQHLDDPPTPIADERPDIPPGFGQIVMTLLEKKPGDRFDSARALADALDQPLDASPGVAIARKAGSAARSNMAIGGAPAGAASQPDEPTDEDLTRWNAPAVRTARQALKWHAWTGGAIAVLRIGTGMQIWDWLAYFWLLSLAVRCARFAMSDFTWRDVFRRRGAHDGTTVAEPKPASRYTERVRTAGVDRDEILQILREMSFEQRASVPGLEATTQRLMDTTEMAALTEQAMDLARDVDAAIAAAEEVRRLTTE